MLAPDLALTGSPEFVDAARAQHATGKPATPVLLAHAPSAPLWVVADGSAGLPVAGNARNLNRLLHGAEYTSIAMTLAARPAIQATSVCRSGDDARRLEESMRALVSLGRFATPIQIRRDGVTVVVQTEVEPAAIQGLLR